MDYQASLPATFCLSKVTLAAGTTTTLSNTGTTTYCIKGKAYTKAAMTNAATPTTDWGTGQAFIPIPIPLSSPNIAGVPNGAAGYGSIYAVGFNAAGDLKVIQGQIAALDANGAFITAPQFGAMGPQGSQPGSNDFCPIGYIVVKLGATAVATWTFGTNNMSGVTGVTYTFVDVITLPDRPQIS